MILFHILMFSQNSTFYIYIIYCQNAPWSGCLLSKNYLSLERLPCKRENWMKSEEEKTAVLNKFVYSTKYEPSFPFPWGALTNVSVCAHQGSIAIAPL
jgi:hypothetical protein